MTQTISFPRPEIAQAVAGTPAGRFEADGARSYDTRIRLLVPGYSTLLELMAPLLASRLGRGEASILISGAGTGAELSELAFQSPRWQFTAVDPSRDMLEIAGRRAQMLGCLEQVSFRACNLADYVCPEPHDAAISTLVAHFLPDDGEKARYFSDLAVRLKPGAPLVLADLARVMETDDRPVYRHWIESVSPDPKLAGRTIDAMAADFHPLAEDRLDELLDAAGFEPAERFFQAFDICGYVTAKR